MTFSFTSRPQLQSECTILISDLEVSEQASVAQSDVHSTGDQEVVRLIPQGPATFFHED